MGIQIAQIGDYIKRCGGWVGQRRKGEIYEKRFIMPADPKTPAQQANRRRFANATIGAKIADEFNHGAGGFIDPYISELNQRWQKAHNDMNGTDSDIHKLPFFATAPVNSMKCGIGKVLVYEDGIDFIADEQELRIDTRVEFCLVWINKNNGQINGFYSHFYYPEVEYDYWIDADLSTAEQDCDLAICMYASKWETVDGFFYFVEPKQLTWG